jgi:hypothetical protein
MIVISVVDPYALDVPDPDLSLFERIRIHVSSSKNSTKNFEFCRFVDFFMTFYI